MRGTVYKRGKTWTIVYYAGKDSSGRWKQRSEGGFPTKREAERILRLRIEAVETSYNSNLSCTTVAGFLSYWLDNYCEQNLAPNTIRGYRTNIEKHIAPYIGKIQLTKLSPKNIQDLYSKLLESGLSSTSVRYVHNNLHKALEYAVKMQSLPRNPAEMVTPPKVNRYEASTLTPEQVVQLLEACGEKEIFWPVLLLLSRWDCAVVRLWPFAGRMWIWTQSRCMSITPHCVPILRVSQYQKPKQIAAEDYSDCLIM